MIRRRNYTTGTSRVETPEYRFSTQGYWFKSEEDCNRFKEHRNRMAKARRVGVDTNNQREYEAYVEWAERGERRAFLDEPQLKLDEIRELLELRGLSNQEFIMKVIEIVERES